MGTSGKYSKDPLGSRIKERYEVRTKTFLPRRTYTIIRLDGKAFHTYTRGCERPYDNGLMEDMNDTAKYLCENIQGARFAYVQSDEISILLTDFNKLNSEAWFDGEVQKIVSVSASMAAAKFNHLRLRRILAGEEALPFRNAEGLGELMDNLTLAAFDARVFSIPDPFEVHNYFVWRQQDATRNSISMGAQSMYSHKELHGKSTSEMQDMMHEKGVNWNDYPVRFKRGGVVLRDFITDEVPGVPVESTRTEWKTVDPPVFTQNTSFTYCMIPVISSTDDFSLLDLAALESF